MFFSNTPAPIFRAPPPRTITTKTHSELLLNIVATNTKQTCISRHVEVARNPKPCARDIRSHVPLRQGQREEEDTEIKLKLAVQGNARRLLDTGDHSDFVVVCGRREWRTHKTILTGCDYFKAAITMGFRESYESKITIEECSEIEIEWLLRYIYTKEIDIEKLRDTLQSKSYLETCARLWFLGDYFALPALRAAAYERFALRCKRYHEESAQYLSTTTILLLRDGEQHQRGRQQQQQQHKGALYFLPDLEAAIRTAWDYDDGEDQDDRDSSSAASSRQLGPLRAYLVTLSCLLHPYLGQYAPSFAALLDECDGFAADFAKALLGFPPTPPPSSSALAKISGGAAAAQLEVEVAGSAERAPVDFPTEAASRRLGECVGCRGVVTVARAGPVGVHEVVGPGCVVGVEVRGGLVYHAPMSVGLFSNPGMLVCGLCSRDRVRVTY